MNPLQVGRVNMGDGAIVAGCLLAISAAVSAMATTSTCHEVVVGTSFG